MPGQAKHPKLFVQTELLHNPCVAGQEGEKPVSVAQLGFLATVVEDCCADHPGKHERTLDEYQFIFERTTTDAICEQHANWLKALAELDGHGVST